MVTIRAARHESYRHMAPNRAAGRGTIGSLGQTAQVVLDMNCEPVNCENCDLKLIIQKSLKHPLIIPNTSLKHP